MTQHGERVIETQYTDSKVTLRRSDGSSIVTFPVTSDEIGSSLHVSSLCKYNYSSVATAPPNSSQVRTNGADARVSTKVWIHRMDNSNTDNKFFLSQAKVGDRLYVQDTDNSDSHVIYTLIEDPIDDGAYLTFNVECETTGGTPLGGTGISVGLFL